MVGDAAGGTAFKFPCCCPMWKLGCPWHPSVLGLSGWGASGVSGSSAPGAGVEQQCSEKMLLCCAFLAASLGPSFPSSGLYWAVGGSAVWTGHPSEAVSQRLGHAVCLQEGGAAPCCLHPLVRVGALRAPGLSVAAGRWHLVAVLCLWGCAGASSLCSCSAFTRANGLGALIDSAPWVGHCTAFTVCTGVGSAPHPSICSPRSAGVVPCCYPVLCVLLSSLYRSEFWPGTFDQRDARNGRSESRCGKQHQGLVKAVELLVRPWCEAWEPAVGRVSSPGLCGVPVLAGVMAKGA